MRLHWWSCPILQMTLLRLREVQCRNPHSGPLTCPYTPAAPGGQLEWYEWGHWDYQTLPIASAGLDVFKFAPQNLTLPSFLRKDSWLGVRANVPRELNFSAVA